MGFARSTHPTISAMTVHSKRGGAEQHRTQRNFASMSEAELADMLQRHGWEMLGPSPL